jgi:hypothetical protein
MNRIESELFAAANEIAAASSHRLSTTALEMVELERQLSQLKTQWEGQLHANSRAASYCPSAGNRHYTCPNCWITYGQTSLLAPVDLSASEELLLRCGSCGRDYGIVARDG